MKLNNFSYLIHITFWYMLGVLHLSLFLYNFFPVKNKSSTSVLDPPEYLNNISLDVKNQYTAEVDRIILIVIDALRYDFITKTFTPYIFSGISNFNGCLLSAKAESPTVTMPRIKAMTTGSIPQFIDLILNFASKEVTDDSFLHRAKAEGKKMVFYGDDTWLNLFPKMFSRGEGTTSFYVTDFTEVDNNVTRHLESELQRSDWDILFLHYLGLDHIGHVHGPFHPLIGQKLEEMDEIINNIFTTVRQQDKRTIILICGDHGMRDEGGHGGSTEPETLVPLVFLGRSCSFKQNSEISQTDIAPTISALLGLKLPADNIGKIITNVMNETDEHLLYLLHYNALNLLQKDQKHFHEFQDIFDQHSYYLKYRAINPQLIIMAYEYKIAEISRKLIQNSSAQNVPLLYLSFCALINILISVLLLQYREFFIRLSLLTLLITIALFYFKTSFLLPYLSYLYFGFNLLILSPKIPQIFFLFPKFITPSILFFIFFATALRTILLISSSYIEQEEQIWYYFWGSATVLGAYENLKSKRWISLSLWIILFGGLRIFRHFDVIVKWLNLQENNIWLTVAFIIGLTGVAKCCDQIYNKDRTLNLLSIPTVAVIFWYRNALYYDKHTVFEARFAIILIIIIGALSFVKYKEIFKSLSIIWMLWISLLMRPHNVLLIPVCFGTSQILFQLVSYTRVLLFFHIWLGYVLFHCQGFSNSLSSLDISPGYVGLTEYSLVFTSFQVICHTYAFHILSMLLLFREINFTKQIKVLHTIIILRLFTLIWNCFCMLLHRQHLFIWSVFSPKLIIESSHSLLLLITLLAYLLIIICTKKHE